MVFRHCTTGSTGLWFLREKKQMRWARQLCYLTVIGIVSRSQCSKWTQTLWLLLSWRQSSEFKETEVTRIWRAQQHRAGSTKRCRRVSLSLWLHSICIYGERNSTNLRNELKKSKSIPRTHSSHLEKTFYSSG